MDKKLKNTIKISVLLLLLLIPFTIIVIGQKSYKKQVCEKLEIKILNDKLKFITKQEVAKYIEKDLKSEIIGKRMQDINYLRIEQTLKQNPFIKNVKARYYSPNTVVVEILQYHPVVKIYTPSENFYIDGEGYIFPEKKGYASYTLVANGKIKSIDKKSVYQNINISQLNKKQYSSIFSVFNVAKHINSDKFWKNLFSQIYVKDEKTIILIPRIGDFVIILGDAMNLKEKFGNLRAFLKHIDKIGWSKYSAINLSYKNQIVVTKK